MIASKTLLDYSNLFSPNDYKKTAKIISILKTNMASLDFRLKNRSNKKLSFKRIKR